jgi:hypothetical protein
MNQNRWWRLAAWISGSLAVSLTVPAAVTALQSGGQSEAMVVATSQLLFALLCWTATAGLCRERPWGFQLGAGLGVFYVLFATVLALNLGAVLELSREMGAGNPALQVGLIVARGAGGLLLLVALAAIRRQGRRSAVTA